MRCVLALAWSLTLPSTLPSCWAEWVGVVGDSKDGDLSIVLQAWRSHRMYAEQFGPGIVPSQLVERG